MFHGYLVYFQALCTCSIPY